MYKQKTETKERNIIQNTKKVKSKKINNKIKAIKYKENTIMSK